MNAALERIEPVLCFAQSTAKKKDWQNSHSALRACVDYAELHRASAHTDYSPANLFQRVAQSAGRAVEFGGGQAANAAGDVEQLASLGRAFVRNAILEHDAMLRAGIAESNGAPVWQLTIDGPGRYPDRIEFGYGLALSFAECEAVWTSATRGGRIDARPGQLELRLKGVRAILETPTSCEAVIAALRIAENRARCLASGEFASVEADALRVGLSAVLAEIDAQDDPRKPCDLAALARESLPATASPDGPVPLEVTIAPELPPVTIRRNRFARMFRSMRALGRTAFTHGGAIRLEIEYDLPQRSVGLLLTGKGKTDCASAEMYVPTIERALELHGGGVETDIETDGFTIMLTVPDAVARELDNWLPGWDTFAARSIQMLRLLKSGGPVLPEDLILHGVLEDELERRLLPRLSVAPAATLVHDLIPRTPNLSASSPQRMEKVLSQLKRGKPKKEICAPAYAAEIVWMFSIDARHAAAIGLKAARSQETEELCRTLASSPVAYISALRLLCRVMHPAPD